jgi:hypothetical protein
MRRLLILGGLVVILLLLLWGGWGMLVRPSTDTAQAPPPQPAAAGRSAEPQQIGPRLASVAPAAAPAAALPARGAGKGNLKDAVLTCGAVKNMLDRVKCYDQLVRDIRDFDEVLSEACPCGREGTQTAALGTGPARSAAGPQAAKTPAQRAAEEAALKAQQQSKAPKDTMGREGFGTGKWKQIPRYKDNGELIAVRIELVAEADIRGQSQKVHRPTMTINCMDKGTEVWMETSFTSAGNATLVTMQYDDEEPFVFSWANTADGKYMGIWAYGEDFAKKSMPYDKLKITFTPDGANSTSTWFDMRGLTLAAKPLRQLCIW